jgi:hypothetical protein
MHLRFLWFVFIDRYGQSGYSVRSVFRELREMRAAERNATATQAFFLQAIASIVNSADVSPRRSAGDNPYGTMASRTVGVIATEPLRQLAAFSELISVYLLYRFVRRLHRGESQFINEAVYAL